MRLADFIRANREPILAEWEAFARSCGPAGDAMDVAALRDHASLMLTAFADDLDTAETPGAQAEKARGATTVVESQHSAAGEHGAGRAASGFTVAQMTAEYRALRASVVRLWTAARGGALDAGDLKDLTRFHEAIDEALAESLVRFEADVEQAKETFLAILGHDLRTPLGAIQTSAAFLLETAALVPAERTLAARIGASAARSLGMVGELLDFTRSRLGGGIPVVRVEGDLLAVVREAVAEVAAAAPARHIDVRTPELDGDAPLAARFDAPRLRQALGNLIGNAVQHGDAGAVTVTVTAGVANPANPAPADGGTGAGGGTRDVTITVSCISPPHSRVLTVSRIRGRVAAESLRGVPPRNRDWRPRPPRRVRTVSCGCLPRARRA